MIFVFMYLMSCGNLPCCLRLICIKTLAQFDTLNALVMLYPFKKCKDMVCDQIKGNISKYVYS